MIWCLLALLFCGLFLLHVVLISLTYNPVDVWLVGLLLGGLNDVLYYLLLALSVWFIFILLPQLGQRGGRVQGGMIWPPP